MAIEYLIGAGIVGTIISVVDQQNLIPAISNNPSKKFWWDMSRYAPAPAARVIPRPSTEQQVRIQELAQLRMEEADARRESKYTVSDYSSPAPPWKPYQK